MRRTIYVLLLIAGILFICGVSDANAQSRKQKKKGKIGKMIMKKWEGKFHCNQTGLVLINKNYDPVCYKSISGKLSNGMALHQGTDLTNEILTSEMGDSLEISFSMFEVVNERKIPNERFPYNPSMHTISELTVFVEEHDCWLRLKSENTYYDSATMKHK